MKYKVGDIVEVIEILPEWDIYPNRDNILGKLCIIKSIHYGMYEVSCSNENFQCDPILLKEKRLRPFIPRDGNQLLFEFMR